MRILHRAAPSFFEMDCVERDTQSPKLRTFHLFWFQVSSLRFFGRQTGKTGIFVMLNSFQHLFFMNFSPQSN